MDTARNVISILSYFVIPLLLVSFPLYGLYKRVPVYESFVEGAKEGFQVAVRIIPYLVAILFAIAMFRASGAMEALTRALDPVLGLIGFPAELLPARPKQSWRPGELWQQHRTERDHGDDGECGGVGLAVDEVGHQ